MKRLEILWRAPLQQTLFTIFLEQIRYCFHSFYFQQDSYENCTLSVSALTPSNIMIPRGQNLTFQCAPDPEHLPVTHHRLKLHIANKTILPDSAGDFNVQNVSLELSDTYAQCMVYSDNDDDPLTVGQPAYMQVCGKLCSLCYKIVSHW